MSRKLFFILLTGAVTASAVVYFKSRSRARGRVLTGIVTTHDVIVSSQIQGRLVQLLVKEGDTVTPGQLVAVIEPRELRADQAYYTHAEESAAAQVREAEAALRYQTSQTRDQIRQAEALLASLEAQQTQAGADLGLAQRDFERAEGLYNQRIISMQTYDQARTTYQAQQARVESLRKQVEAQRAVVALARATAEQIAMRESQLGAGRQQWAAAQAQKERAAVRLEYTRITAPIAGIVAVCAARQGEVVNAGQAILSLINPDDLWVRADVEETYIDRIRLGDRLPVRLPSGVERVGTVFYRGMDASFATQRDVSRTKRDIKTFEIRLRVDNRDRRLQPGLTAFVTVPLDASP